MDDALHGGEIALHVSGYGELVSCDFHGITSGLGTVDDTSSGTSCHLPLKGKAMSSGNPFLDTAASP